MGLMEDTLKKGGIAFFSIAGTAIIGLTLGSSSLIGVYKTAFVIDRMEKKALETVGTSKEIRATIRPVLDREDGAVKIEDVASMRPTLDPVTTSPSEYKSRVEIVGHERPAPAIPEIVKKETTKPLKPFMSKKQSKTRTFKEEAVPQYREITGEIPDWARDQLAEYVRKQEKTIEEERAKRSSKNEY